MAAEHRNGAARWSRFVPLCAISAIVIGAGACLNPLPDDFPNGHDDSSNVDGPGDGNVTPGTSGGGGGGSVDLGTENGGNGPQSPPAAGDDDPREEEPGRGDAGDAGTRADRRTDAGPEPLDAGAPSGAEP